MSSVLLIYSTILLYKFSYCEKFYTLFQELLDKFAFFCKEADISLLLQGRSYISTKFEALQSLIAFVIASVAVQRKENTVGHKSLDTKVFGICLRLEAH